MEVRAFGNTGKKIPVISFGCMSLKGNTEQDSIALLHEALDKGICYFDTADIYEKGHNEEVVGKALKDRRHKVWLATKAGNVWNGNDQLSWNPRKAHILSAAEQSLQRLQTDYIDVYQLHGGTIDDPFDEIIEAFELLQKQGKILHYGISSIRPNVVRRYVGSSGISSNMLQYSLLDRRPEEALLPLLYKAEKAVLVRGALAQGLLINKPAKNYLTHELETVQSVQELLRLMGSEYQLSPAQLAINYVLQQEGVTSIVAGIRNSFQLNELMNNIITLPEEVLAKLRQQIPMTNYIDHR